MSRQSYATNRRYVVDGNKEYLVDVFSLNGFTAIAQDLSTAKLGKASHETSENIAVTDAINKTKK